MGELLECSCDRNNMKKKQQQQLQQRKLTKKLKELSVPSEGEWEWGGCGDNINFGVRKSKDFMDRRYKRRSDMKTLVKLHNYAAGRLVSLFINW